MKVVILGAGMAGFGAFHRLQAQGIRPVLYEKEAYYGGRAASFRKNGFTFDDGPHISFSKNERIQNLFAQSAEDRYEVIQARANNHWRGFWIKHPAQCNLCGLPPDLVVEILLDFIQIQEAREAQVSNYQDWLIANYGKAFAETFPMQYALKYHTTAANNMSTDWMKPRFYRPNLREVLYGALSSNTKDVHYVDHFRYPTEGGFVSFLHGFAKLADIRLHHELVHLDPKRKLLQFVNGNTAPYDFVISSLPLTELIPIISGVPDSVPEAAERLACTTCILVTIGLDREDISETHWIYFYDQDFFFTRLSFPHMQSRNNAPPGTGIIQAEIYYSNKYRPLDRSPQECIQPVISDLKRCGLIHEGDELLFTDARVIPYANIIFDLDRSEALNTVHRYLDEIGVHYCGRYGEWAYHWSDEAFMSGEQAAQKVLDKI